MAAGPVVGRAEVAVAVDHRQPHRPRLRHAHQRVVDRAVAVRVQPTHHLADHAGGLHVAAVGAQPHVRHRVEDPALHRLEPVAGVGQGAGVDDRVGVLQEAGPHLLADVDVDDVLLEVRGEGVAGAASAAGASARGCHGGIVSRRALAGCGAAGGARRRYHPARSAQVSDQALPGPLGGRRRPARRRHGPPAPDRPRGRRAARRVLRRRLAAVEVLPLLLRDAEALRARGRALHRRRPPGAGRARR